MVDIIKFRKDSLIEKRNRFKDEEEINNHINFIEEENKITKKKFQNVRNKKLVKHN